MSCLYYTVDDVIKMLGVSKSVAYRIIRELNEDLKASGYIIIAGRVPKKWLHDHYYGIGEMDVNINEKTI